MEYPLFITHQKEEGYCFYLYWIISSLAWSNETYPGLKFWIEEWHSYILTIFIYPNKENPNISRQKIAGSSTDSFLNI